MEKCIFPIQIHTVPSNTIKLRHSQPRFSKRRLTTYQHPYPELQGKAWNVTWDLYSYKKNHMGEEDPKVHCFIVCTVLM